MFSSKIKLNPNLFNKKKLEQVPTRDGYGKGLVELGEKNKNVVVLCADLTESTRSLWFKEKFPDRFIEVGVAEQNLATIASGFANYGKIPFISSYAVFSPGRNWEQIRTTICYNDVPVKVAGAHSGISVGPDGATHQALEDMAIMRALPNMIVLAPCDWIETKKATIEAAKINKPVYIRFAREKTPVITVESTPFEIGRASIYWDEGNDAAIIACGPLLYNALIAAKDLKSKKIKVKVINCPTIKPLDENLILDIAKKTKAIVTVEEHQITGGLGGAISEFLAKKYPVPIEFIGVQDKFGQSGRPEELIEYYGMGINHIKEAVKTVIKRKTAPL